MQRLIKKYIENNKGAIAVETAIVMPLMLIILLPSIDIGFRVHTMQKMNKATDSGIEYVVRGGRNENTLRNIVQDSYGSSISSNELAINAYCGCIETGQANGGDEENGSVNHDPHAGFYIKTQTTLSEDMCPVLCDDGNAPSELVELTLARMVKGTVSDRRVRSRLQTRLK